MGLKIPVLMMGFVPPSELYDLDCRSSRRGFFSPVTRVDRVRIGSGRELHFRSTSKIDIGTKRQGVSVDALPELFSLASQKSIEVVGVASHFANIEDTIEHEFARVQLQRFHEALEVVRRELRELPPHIHASCSAAALLFRETDFTLARVGISMYGHWPSRETRLSWSMEHQGDGVNLQPVLTWKTSGRSITGCCEG